MRRSLIFLPILLAFILCGCSSINQEGNTMSAMKESSAKENKTEDNSTESSNAEANTENSSELLLPDHDTGDEVTPYQYLYLMVGNASEVAFSYEQTVEDTEDILIGSFAMKSDMAAECFMAYDMNENLITVRELEKDGKVHYILEDSGRVCTYQGPSDDFILYQMLEASKTSPESALQDGEYMRYEHKLYFGDDEEMYNTYLFYMKENAVRKLDVINSGGFVTHYEFSDFTQEVTDETIFNYPMDYHEESYDYQYTYEFMPPWWDVGNDA